ncbi:hypothetical protein EVAR_2951_1 [Eumeta japonica]|uniref:Uncharacterized protein n=1 Tax=Eumeta variegata TaxID=151549 RepID=A0A4C1T137_EUMVA|nr:hypothetical protein EVAR_2951_1 [Eumeta japonica]
MRDKKHNDAIDGGPVRHRRYRAVPTGGPRSAHYEFGTGGHYIRQFYGFRRGFGRFNNFRVCGQFHVIMMLYARRYFTLSVFNGAEVVINYALMLSRFFFLLSSLRA